MSQRSRISGWFPANELNSVSNYVNLGDDIPIETEFKAGKELIISFQRWLLRRTTVAVLLVLRQLDEHLDLDLGLDNHQFEYHQFWSQSRNQSQSRSRSQS